MKRRVLLWYLSGFVMPPVAWLLSCWLTGLWSGEELLRVALAPQINLYVMGWLVGVYLLVRRWLGRMEREAAAGEVASLQRDLAWLPASFLVLVALYCLFGPLVSMAGKPFIDPTERLLGEILGVPIIISFSIPFFLKVDELLGRWCPGVSLEGQRSMSLRVKLLVTVIGLSVGLTLICGVAAYAIAYETRGTHVLAALRGRILGLILGEVALASLIGWQITGLVGPLREVARALRRLARGGRELDQRVAVLTRDEIGEVAWWFNRFVDAMRGRVSFKRAVEDDRDLDEVYARIYKLLRERFGVREAVIYEVNNSRNRMSPVGEVEARWCCPEVLVDVGRCRAVRTARPVSSLDDPEICFSFTCPGERRHVCIPMVVGGYIGNVVQLVFGPEVEAQEAQVRVEQVTALLEEISSVIEAKRLLAQLRDSSMRDPLTGLYNRRFFEEYVEMLVAAAQRKQAVVGLMMCDLDHFKQVNDSHGHDVGDELLRTVAQALRRSVRASDLVVRYGGEEFLVVLTETDPQAAMNAAERLRQEVAAQRLQARGAVLRATISLGVSLFPLDSENIWDCIRFADLALYRAKQRGRNRAVRFDPSMLAEAESAPQAA